MTTTLKPTNALTEKAVANFLKEQPDFFQRHLSLLSSLRITHTERGAISLVEMQISRLRERVSELEEEITQLMTIAVSNEKLYYAISEAHRDLFVANNIYEIEKLLEKLADKLSLQVDLRFFDHDRLPLAKLDVQRIKLSHFSGQNIYLGRLRKVDGEVFVTNAPELGSYLLLPIIIDNKESGFLSFASPDGGHFQPNMDTLFVEQLASHIAATASLMKS